MSRNRGSDQTTDTLDPLEQVESVPEGEVVTDTPTVDPTTGEAPAPDGEKDEAKPKKNARPAPPEGYVTFVTLAKEISKQLLDDPTGQKLRPQMVYGYDKNNKSFPAVDSTELGEAESRRLIKLADGLQFYRDLMQRRVDREAAKAEKAQKAAEAQTGEAAEAPATSEEAPSS